MVQRVLLSLLLMNLGLTKIITASVIAIGSLSVAGCSSDLSASESNSETGSTAFGAEEIMFAQMMIPHHQQALEMSDLALERSENPDILALAAAIKEAQKPEISIMQSWVLSQGAESTEVDPHAGHDMGSKDMPMDMGTTPHGDMDGMLTDQQMEQLATAEGAEFDRLFLTGMIAHHEGAVKMAEAILTSKNSAVKEFAEKLIADQTAEIAYLRELL